MDKWIKENKITTAIIIILIFWIGIVYRNKPSVPAKEPVENVPLQNTTDIGSQEKCAKQALQIFNQAGYQNNELAGYINHYNQKLNKCFVEIQSTDVKTSPGTIWNYKNLFDAYEGKIYGEYAWHTEKDKKYWEVPPYICFMYPDGNQNNLQTCKSEGEFDTFVNSFMEN